MPAAIRASSNVIRSSADIEFASLLVPNTASPQFFESNHWQCLTNRSRSGERSALNGVTTGASTPRMRWLGGEILVSGIAACVAAAVPAATPSHATLVPTQRQAAVSARGYRIARVFVAEESGPLMRSVRNSIVIGLAIVLGIGQALAGEFDSILRWRNIGPYRGGRTRAIYGVPSQPNV